MRAHGFSCGWFWAWALAGGLLLVSLLSVVAVFTAVPALALLFLAARRSRWPEQLGVLAGAGALCVLIAALNWNEQGGLDPAPWLGAGAVLLAGGIGGYAAARRRLS